jgi:hypothetical protein
MRTLHNGKARTAHKKAQKVHLSTIYHHRASDAGKSVKTDISVAMMTPRAGTFGMGNVGRSDHQVAGV